LRHTQEIDSHEYLDNEPWIAYVDLPGLREDPDPEGQSYTLSSSISSFISYSGPYDNIKARHVHSIFSVQMHNNVLISARKAKLTT
jgi:hypothetical protein